MNRSMEIEQFVKSPDLLIDLCRAVVAQLDVQLTTDEAGVDFAAMDAQLREIAKTIDRLEKMAVPIPDVLRSEKTRLAVVLGVQDTAKQALNLLAESLSDVARGIRANLNRHSAQSLSSGKQPERINSDRLPRTDLRNSIVRSIQALGGRSSPKDICQLMESDLKGQLLAGDLVWLELKRKYAWQRAVEDERPNMIRDGILRSDSPVGIWELSEKHK